MTFGKRIIFALLIGLAGWFLCFGSRPREDVPKDFVVVEYWEKWVGTEADDMRQIVDDFNRTVGMEKHIYVRYLSMSKLDQKLLIATAAGTPPDVAGLWDPQIAEFASLGALEPLDDLAAAHGIDQNTYQPGYWKACHYQGRLWSLVSTPACVALFYNKRLFEQAGLDPKHPPGTLAELDRDAAALNEIDAAGHIRRAGYLPMEPGWYIDFTWCWFGGRLFDEKTQKFTLDSPANIAAFEWVRDYSKRMGADAMVEFHDAAGGFDSPQNPFLTGEVAMIQQGPWMANYIYRLTHQEPWKPSMSEAKVPRERESELPDRRDNCDWAAAPFPSAVAGEQNVSYCSFDNLVIPHGARHVGPAFEFMAYVNRPDVMEKLCTLQCKSSPLRKVSDDFLAHHPNPYIGVFNELSASPNARFAPQVPIFEELKKAMDDVAQSVCLLDKEPAEALREAQASLQSKLDRQLRIDAARRVASP